MNFDNPQQAQQVFELALGRILRMGARPAQVGDTAEFDRCKDLIDDAAEYLGKDITPPYNVNFISAYNKTHHD